MPYNFLLLIMYFPNHLIYMLGVARGGVKVKGNSRNNFGVEMFVYFTLDFVNIIGQKF